MDRGQPSGAGMIRSTDLRRLGWGIWTHGVKILMMAAGLIVSKSLHRHQVIPRLRISVAFRSSQLG
jgi:hypothetical protein